MAICPVTPVIGAATVVGAGAPAESGRAVGAVSVALVSVTGGRMPLLVKPKERVPQSATRSSH